MVPAFNATLKALLAEVMSALSVMEPTAFSVRVAFPPVVFAMAAASVMLPSPPVPLAVLITTMFSFTDLEKLWLMCWPLLV